MERRGSRLSRRAFVVGATSLGLLAGCGRWPGQAEPPAKVARIGMLSPGPPGERLGAWAAFHQALVDLGYVEGQNISFEYRYADGRNDRWDVFAAELVQIPVDLIFTPNTPAALAARRATSSIPIVLPVGDPVATGLAQSLARPGANVTGLTNISVQLSGKRLELLQETVPRLSRVAMLWQPANAVETRDWEETQAAARLLGVELQSVELYQPFDLEGAFAALARGRVEAVLVRGTAMSEHGFSQVGDLGRRFRLPVMADRRALVEAGALMAYGPSLADQYRRAAAFVDKILKGAKPADLPVEQPMTFEFVVNLKTAQAIGITFPNEIMLQVTEVIQ
jgi:putative tryptophan/tyrosine transport system substrate-binding protein